jgi:hypothetical protein
MRTWTSSQLRVSPGRNRCRRNSPSLSSVYLKRDRSRGGDQDLKGCICIERATIFAETGERVCHKHYHGGKRDDLAYHVVGVLWSAA